MKHVLHGGGGMSYCKRCSVEVYASWPLLELAEEVVEAVEAAIESPDFATTGRVTKALEAWRAQVPSCSEAEHEG